MDHNNSENGEDVMKTLMRKTTSVVLIVALLLSLTAFVPAYAVEEPSDSVAAEMDETGQEPLGGTEEDETPPSVGESNEMDTENEPSAPAAGTSNGEDAADGPENEDNQSPASWTGENETEEPEEPENCTTSLIRVAAA